MRFSLQSGTHLITAYRMGSRMHASKMKRAIGRRIIAMANDMFISLVA